MGKIFFISPDRFVLMVLFSICQFSIAGTEIDQSQRQADVIQQKQQQQIEQDQLNARPVVQTDGIDLKTLEPKVPKPSGSSGKCQEITTIEIQGGDHLAAEVKNKINLEFAEHCLGVDEISRILSLITKNYVDQGFVTTRAYLPVQDIKSGILKIVVVEGLVEHFKIDDKGAKSVSVKTVFPGLEGKILNLRDLEQGIDQVNRLQSNVATLDIQPGDVVGGSVVVVHNDPKFPVHLLTSYDNQGIVGTGRDQAAATVTGDNLVGLNESMAVTHRVSIPANDQTHYSDSSDFNAQLPLGYTTIGIDANQSSYVNLLLTPSGSSLPSSGTNGIRNISVDQMVYRDQKTRLLISTNLTTKKSNNYLANQLLVVSSRKLTDLDVKGMLSTAIGKNLVSLKLTLTKGLSSLGAMQDSSNLATDEPHAQFQKISAEVRLKVPFTLFNQTYSYDTTFTQQHSSNPLYGSEQILIGSIYTVRGFVNNTLTGDDGFFWRNDLSLIKQFTIGEQTISGRFYLGIDTGCVTNQAPGMTSGCLTGTTVGFSTQWLGLTWDVFRSSPYSQPSNMPRESAQLWLRLSAAM